MLKRFLLLCIFSVWGGGAALAEKLMLPLNKLVPVKMIELKCTSGTRVAYLPIPERWKIRSARLSVHYINSTNLLKEISQLSVIVNDSKVGQVKLNPEFPENTLVLDIPSNILEAGYNEIKFQVAQHFMKEGCELPCAPDLWTYVNTDLSSIEIDYELKPVPLNMHLAAGFTFDPRIITDNIINLVLENNDADMVTIAGIAASGIARKFVYRPVSFSISETMVPGRDNVLIGKKEFVEQMMGGYQTDLPVTEPLIKVLPLPHSEDGRVIHDPAHALFIVTGITNEHLKMAAETMAIMNFPFPGSDEIRVREFRLPDVTMYSGKNIITTEKQHRFRALEFKTHTFRGMQPAPAEITFRLPPDFMIKQNEYAKINLNFAYGAGMRLDSALNILVNDTHVRAINLDKQTGDSISGYKIELPTYLFKPGANVLRFVSILTPVAKECDIIQPDSFFLTVFDNSSFYIPSMPHLIEMPKVELFMLNGFPLTRWPDGYESFIQLATKDKNTIEAALNVMGVITQKNEYPLFGIEMGYSIPAAWQGEILVMGDVASIPPNLMAAAPLKLADVSEISYQVNKSEGWEGGGTSYATVKETGRLSDNSGLVMEFESPFKKARTVVMMTANTTAGLLDLSKALQDAGVQGQLKGNLSVIALTPPDYRIDSIGFGEKYLTGKKGEVSTLEYFVYNNPYLYYIIGAVMFVIIAIVVMGTARRFRLARTAEKGIIERRPIMRQFRDMLREMFMRKPGR